METTNYVKQAQKTFSYLGLCYLAGTAVMYLLQELLAYALKTYSPQWAGNTNIVMILSTVIVYGCAMPLIALLVKKMEVQKPERRKMKWWQFLIAFLICYAIVYVSNIIGVAMTTAIGMLKKSAVENNVAQVVTSGNLLVNFVSMVIFAPIVEELVFRKLIVDRTVKYGQGIAVLTSGLMFGLFHGNLNQFAYAVGLGCFLAFLYLRTGNLKITIALHAIINFMGSMVAGTLLKMVRYDQLMMLDANDTDTMMTMIMEDIVGWMILICYVLFVFVAVIVGIVFFILSVKKMKSIPQETDLPKEQRLKALFINPGMIVFCVTWVVLIVLQLFS